MKLDVYNKEGEKTGRQVDLPDELFGIEPNENVVYQAVRQYTANKRQGTHSAKERSQLSGSRKKIKRQKGTGTARSGDIKSPIFRGGARVFGPRPRDYSFKMNKREKRLARSSALSSKAGEGRVKVLEDFSLDQPKTKEYANILKNLAVDGTKTLLVLDNVEHNLALASRNIPKASITRYAKLNTYEVLNSDYLIFSESSASKLEELK